MAESPRILFYFLHLLGVGHVFRAKRLIEGFHNAGMKTDVIYGGAPVPGVSFQADSVHYLPPIRAADSAYSNYLDANDEPLEKPFLERRKQSLLEVFETLSPDLILIEAFPFGRRIVRHELGALFDQAATREKKPLIVTSVRDILQERKKPGRNEETRDWITNAFDHVLVHSDPDIIRLDDTFPFAREIDNKLSYTGFVLPNKEPDQNEVETFDVIVSAGGGAFGGELMQTALAVANERVDMSWCLTTGPNLPDNERELLASCAVKHIAVRTSLKNLSGHMGKARLSISQCGYNTAMDVLAAHRDSRCRAIFVPYDTTGQTEQLKRSELLEKAGYSINLPQSTLTTENLNSAIDKALALPRSSHEVDFDGVENSAKLIRSWLDKT